MITNSARYGVVALSWLFAAGVVGQVFLAGLSLFDSALRWDDHRAFGSVIGIVPILLLVCAVVGRLPLRLIGGAALLFWLYGLQFAFAHAANGYVAALHPVNAIALFSLAVMLGRGARRSLAGGASATGEAERLAGSRADG